MEVDVLFAAIAVRDFPTARHWYERFFDRPPDVVAHDTEVMWQVTATGWLYIVGDPERAGSSVVTIAVTDIERVAADLSDRGLAVGPIEPESDTAVKAKLRDPDGNTVALIEVASDG
jgi:predicted enzyme related to lactoylglutathione lyase